MKIAPPPGFVFDDPWVNFEPRWLGGYNIRYRLGKAETVGLHGPLKDVDGNQITLPGTTTYRKIFTTPSTTEGQILVGAEDSLQLIDYDPTSTIGTGTRWRTTPVTPASLPPTVTIGNPSAGRVEIPPVWWFADQDDVVVGCRTNVTAEPTYAWDRNRANPLTSLANSPTGAVGGAIVNRILVLLGCTSFTDPDPAKAMTIRWSDRFNFEDWTPSDINLSGELQLEGGSRIVGGGFTAFGVCAWTDRRLAVLNETGSVDSVFARDYIDGSSGLLANRTWCEADNRVWWLDVTKNLVVYDGGRPRTIPMPVRYATVERISDRQFAYAYMVANTEYNEIAIWYPDNDGDIPNRALVYNYLLDAWYVHSFVRPAWCSRFGVIKNLGIDETNNMYQHDLDVAPPPPWTDASTNPPAADVTAFDWELKTNLISSEVVTDQTWTSTRVNVDHLPNPAAGAEADTMTVTMDGYGQATRNSTVKTDTKALTQGGRSVDMRTGGKAVQITLSGTGHKTHWRVGEITLTGAEGGQR